LPAGKGGCYRCLWAITRNRIGVGMMGHKAKQLLTPLLSVVEKYLALEGVPQEPAQQMAF
jgi:hypothetical protein